MRVARSRRNARITIQAAEIRNARLDTAFAGCPRKPETTCSQSISDYAPSPPETGGSNATSSPSAIGVERAARSPFTTNDDTAATAAKRSPNRADSASTTSPTVLPEHLGLGGVGGLAQRGEQPHPDHDTSSVSWITRASRRPNAGVKPSSA